MTTRARGLGGVLAMVALLVAPAWPGATGGRVLAHAQLVASSPGAGEVVDEAPTELRLVFSERLEAQGTAVDVTTPDGETIVSGAGEVDPTDPYALLVGLPTLGDGAYSVTWRTLSADDGHPAEGFFTFGIGEVGEALPSAGSEHGHVALDAVAVAARWLTYPGLLLGIGVPMFHRVALREPSMPARLRRWLGWALVLAAAASVLAAIRAGLDAGDVAAYLTGTRTGVLLLARAAVTAVGGALLLAGPQKAAGAAALVAGLAGTLLHVMAGHAAALPGLVGLVAQWAHVVGAAVWFGGVVALAALLVRPGLLVEGGRRPDLRAIVPRFSALALVAIGLVGLTGVHAAWSQTGTILDPTTDYGRTLLLKTTFAAGALALGGLNFLDGGRMRGWLDGLRSRASLEAVVIVAVLAGSAILAVTPPTEEAAGVAIEPQPDAFGFVAPDMSMEIVPGRPGVNRAVVTTSGALEIMTLSLSLERLDAAGSSRVPLVPTSGDGAGGHAHGVSSGGDDDAVWVADALVLPAGSRWESAVRIQADGNGTELSRQRFAFVMGGEGIAEGEVPAGLDPGLGAGIVLVLLGTLALGAGLGGARLPRTDPRLSGAALVVGGLVATLLGAGIGVERLLGIA